MKLGDRIALFYEEPEYARILNFHYIRNGLVNGERGIYLVLENQNDYQNDDYTASDKRYSRSRKIGNKKNDEDNLNVEFIKREMGDSQIDVSQFISEGLLYVGKGPDLLDFYDKLRLTRNSNEPFESILPGSFSDASEFSSFFPINYRLVLDVQKEQYLTDYNLEDLLKLEQSYHSAFHSLQGSSICTYSVSNVEQTLTDYSEYGKLTTARLNSHTGVIFTRKFGRGLALKLE